MKKKFMTLIAAATAAVLMLTSCSGTGISLVGEDDSDTIVLECGHVLTEDSPYNVALEEFAKEVKKETDGRVEIRIFANSVLGNERDMIESVQLGNLDMLLTNTAPMANFTNVFKVFDLPFLFQTRDSAYKVIDSDIGDNMLKQLDDMGVVGLSLWENGFRYIANNKKKVSVPSDLKGLKIRTMENSIHMASFRAWGADATSMAWGEVYTGLEQGTIDGLENPITPIYQNRMYEVAEYISMTGHFYCPAPFIMSKSAYNKLEPQDQKTIRRLAEKYKDVERRYCVEYDEKYLKEMKKEGCVVTENIDKQAWRDAAQSVYDEYSSVVGEDVLKKIQDMIGEGK